ncbi:MAG: hypothetical protein KGJ06_02035, partial [Pseudomonadota bacterium]|nr:hypothetical protein [Pseudomonadota bacterium]
MNLPARSDIMVRNMILGQLRTGDVRDERVLAAMQTVPRERFLPENLQGAAYVDEDLETHPGRYLMAPLTFARLLALAEISESSRVLVVGALNGYPA